MAYITKEEIKAKREALKAAFPSKEGWKFSVTGGNTSSVRIALMQFPNSPQYKFEEQGDVNHYHSEASIKRLGYSENESKVIKKMIDVANDGHWDKSDIMTDYFNCSYYIDISVGKWNKPAVAKVVK